MAMNSQIDRIVFLTEKGWHPYEGSIAETVYDRLGCKTPFFGKWLYDGRTGRKATCIGCAKYCVTDSMEGFTPIPTTLMATHKRGNYFSLSPVEMANRLHLLTVKQAAYCLNVSIRTVYSYIDMSKLAVLREKPIRIKAEDVRKMMNDFDE